MGSALKSTVDEMDSPECKSVAQNLRVMGSAEYLISY